jgi:hypothetical protein
MLQTAALGIAAVGPAVAAVAAVAAQQASEVLALSIQAAFDL